LLLVINKSDPTTQILVNVSKDPESIDGPEPSLYNISNVVLFELTTYALLSRKTKSVMFEKLPFVPV
jgi:hypothetical protein